MTFPQLMARVIMAAIVVIVVITMMVLAVRLWEWIL